MNTDKQSNRFKESPKVRDDRYRKRYNNESNYKNTGTKYNIFMRDKNEKEKEKQLDPTIFSSSEHFPELISSKPTSLTNEKEEEDEQSMKLYSDIVETEVKKEENIEEFKLKPGWILIDKSKKYNKTDDSENEYFVNLKLILQKTNNLYERRKNEYIELYGDDNYEKMFKFPNYDYEYFDRLDYLYELEMETSSNGNNEMYDENQDYDDLYTYEMD
jgi:hypothetical protein